MCSKVKIMQIKCVFSKKGAWLRFFMLGNSLLWKFFCANSRKKSHFQNEKPKLWYFFLFSSLNIYFKWFETKCSTKMDFRFRHTFMEKSALKMIGCLSTKKKLDTKHHFNLREKKRWNHCCFQSANRYFNWKKKY